MKKQAKNKVPYMTQEDIEDKTSLLFDLIAETVMNRAIGGITIPDSQREAWTKYLVDRLVICYNYNQDFRKGIDGSGNKGRDTTYMWFNYWAGTETMDGQKRDFKPMEFMISMNGWYASKKWAKDRDRLAEPPNSIPKVLITDSYKIKHDAHVSMEGIIIRPVKPAPVLKKKKAPVVKTGDKTNVINVCFESDEVEKGCKILAVLTEGSIVVRLTSDRTIRCRADWDGDRWVIEENLPESKSIRSYVKTHKETTGI